MAKVYIIGKKGSKACSNIRANTGINRFTNNRDADVVVNYGLSGVSFDLLARKNPRINDVPIINRYIGCSKYTAVKEAENAGVLVPESRILLPKDAVLKDWIEKRVNSSQGIGIKKATKRTAIPGKYYQKMISNRKFELRVHAFKWLPMRDWRVNKRIGPQDQIAWNFHQGGRFSLVYDSNGYKMFREAKEVALKILEMRRMAFGAVDFIVNQYNKVYFIEINSSPGFEELNAEYYYNAFRRLKELSRRDVLKFC